MTTVRRVCIICTTQQTKQKALHQPAAEVNAYNLQVFKRNIRKQDLQSMIKNNRLCLGVIPQPKMYLIRKELLRLVFACVY